MTFIWSLTLYEMAEGFRVVIKNGNGRTVTGKGRTPQEAHRAAEIQLVVKPWVVAERLRSVLEWYAKADYDRRVCDDGDGHIDVWGAEEILADKGKRAREALKVEQGPE